MVMSRKRKMSLAGITETRKEQKQELKQVERLSRSKKDRSADGAKEAAVESSSGA